MGLKFSTQNEQTYEFSQNMNGDSIAVRTCKDPKKFTKQYSTIISQYKDGDGETVFTYTKSDRVEAGHDHYVNQAKMHRLDTSKYEKFVE